MQPSTYYCLGAQRPQCCPLTFSCPLVWVKMVWSVLCLTLFLPGPLTNLPSGAYLPPPPRNSAVKRKKGDVREKGGNKVFGKQRVLQQPQVLWKQFRNNLLPAQLLSAQPAAHPVWPPGCSLPKSQPPPTFQISDGRELVKVFEACLSR